MYLFLSKLTLGVILIFFQLSIGGKASCESKIDQGIFALEYIYPKENQVVYYQNLKLNWQHHGGEFNQRFQLSRTKDFSETFIDTLIQGFSFEIESLEKNKEFYWRISDTSRKTDNSYMADYSFFKTTSLNLEGVDSSFALNLIPTHTGDQQLLFIDNPGLLNYSISIFSADENIKKFDRITCSANQCVPVYKLPKGKYILKIHFFQKEPDNISEILLTQNE